MVIMKKLLFFAAAMLCMVACSNRENEPTAPGRPITISATVQIPSGENAPIRKVAPNDLSASTVSFHWEAGDKVIIKNATGDATFTIIDDSISADGKSAKFTGDPLSDMSSYEVYYGYASKDTNAVQELPYLKDSIFRPFIKGTGNSTGFTLNSFLPVLKINIAGRLINQATLDSLVYKIGTKRNVAQSKAKMTMPIGTAVPQNDPMSIYFPVPQTNNGDSIFIYIYYTSTSIYTKSPKIQGSLFNLSGHMNKIINFNEIALAACFAAGTRITMADGSTKAIEDIVKGDRVRTFDHEAGQLSEEAVCYVFDNGLEANPFTLHFASGKTLSIVDKHDLLVESSRKYVVVSQSNASTFVGQRFYNADKAQWDELTSVTYGTTPTKYYTIYSAYHINTIANGMLTCPDDIDFNLNIYEMDETLKADPAQLAADRAQYGYFTSADFPELTKDLDAFDALNRNTKIALGKGLVTWERLMQIYEDYK